MTRPLFHDPYAHQPGLQDRRELVPTVKGSTLHVPTFSCGRCHQASQQTGSGYLRHRGVRMHVCSSCKTTLRQRVAAARANPTEVA